MREIVREVGEGEIEKSATFCPNVTATLPWKLEFEETNVALSMWLPGVKDAVVKAATPAESELAKIGVVLPSR